MPFSPTVNFQLSIGNKTYTFTEHPVAKGMLYGQQGRRAMVYQVKDENQRFYAFKIFKHAFRSPRIAQASERLKAFAGKPGLAVCEREVLTAHQYGALIGKYPDLEFAVIMPWMLGETWQEVVLSQRPLEYRAARTLAEQMAVLMVGMEQGGLAHCDIAGPNVLVDFSRLNGNANTVEAISLVDVEEMYGPGFERPDNLPAGTPGYDHIVAKKGLWSLDADRFAGAVMMAEMLTRHDGNIRRASFTEQYFDPTEMQQNTYRYQQVVYVLKNNGDSLAADLFARAWFSQTLSECPTFTEWYLALNSSSSISITTPGVGALPDSSLPGYPVRGWQAFDPGGRKPSNPPISNHPVSNQPVSHPPVTVPLETIKPMLLKSAEEGNWMAAYNIAGQILQNYPADSDALSIQTRAQVLIQMEQAIQSLWQAASLSGTVEGWENCLRTITAAQYQAPKLERYQKLREETEKEYEIAVRAQALSQLIDDSLWDEAESLRGELPLDHPRIAELFARLDMAIGNQRRSAKLAEQAHKAVLARNWTDVVRYCREGLTLTPDLQGLRDLLDMALREQKLDAEISDTIREAKQAVGHGNWEEAEAKLKNALKLQPGRENLQEMLEEVRQKLSWARLIEQVAAQINHSPESKLLADLQPIPAGFGEVDDIRNILKWAEPWRVQVVEAQKTYDLKKLDDLLTAAPDKRIQAPEALVWLKAEIERERLVIEYFQSYNVSQVEAMQASFPNGHPLHDRCQKWLAEVQERRAEIIDARARFEPAQVLALLGQVGPDFPDYENQRQWAEESLAEQKILLDARERRDLAELERMLGQLPKDHPARVGIQSWLNEEKNRKKDLQKARAVFDVEKTAQLLAGISADLPTYSEDWNWLQEQRSLLGELEEARKTCDVDRMQTLIKGLPKKHPRLPEYKEWLQEESSRQKTLWDAKKVYDLQAVRDQLAQLPADHPLRNEGLAWLTDIEERASRLGLAREEWDYAQVLTLLEGLDEEYPDYSVLHKWAEQGLAKTEQAQNLVANRESDALEALLANWDSMDPQLTKLTRALKHLRAQEQEQARLLTEAETAIAAQDWQAALHAGEKALLIPMPPARLAEIVELAGYKLEMARKADELLRLAQTALSQNRYVDALNLAVQCTEIDPDNIAYKQAALEMQESLRKLARSFEAKGQWEHAMKVWSALKQVVILAPAPPLEAESKPVPVAMVEADGQLHKSTALIEKARAAMQADRVEQAAQWLQNADRKDYAVMLTINDLTSQIRRQIQIAEKANQWERVKKLWALIKQLQS